MKRGAWLGLAAVAMVIAGAWLLVRPPELPDDGSAAGPADSATQATARRKLGAASVLAIDLRTGTRPAPPARRSLFNDYLRSRNYRAMYERLKSSPEGQTPEGLYVLYDLLKRCAAITDRTSRQPLVRTAEQRRDEFVAGIPANDPQRGKRIAAFEDIAANRCAGMEGISIRQADLDKLLVDSAALGDPKAQAYSLEQALWAERRAGGPDTRWGPGSVTVTDAQVATLRSLAASGDPEAMVIAGRVMSSAWHDFQVQVDDQPVQRAAFNEAWQLLACEYGHPCDAGNARVQAGCAYQGYCDAQSLPDFIYYYAASPNDSQLMARYREVLRDAILTGNWSQVNVARGLPDANLWRPGSGG
ncbi:MAG TPA: hypothetical protein VLT89_14035 [Usitatibacter sp.]|nr:hypothetical protein [Usitatibacter sp.]